MAKVDLFKQAKETAQANIDKVQGQDDMITVLDIVPAQSVVNKETGAVLEKVRVITKEYGSLWCFKTAVVNALSSYGDGVKAKATLVPNNYKDAQGNPVNGFNLQRLVIQAIESKIEAAISKMPAGTALFASAGAL